MYKVKTTLLESHDKGQEISKGVYNNLITAGCPKDWFEKVEQFEKGDWVVAEPNIILPYDVGRIVEYKSNESYRCPSIVNFGYIAENNVASRIYAKVKRKATKDEIEQTLIKEAKRRGVEAKGKYNTNFECIYDSGNMQDLSFQSTNGFAYSEKTDTLWYYSNVVYHDGDWAEIRQRNMVGNYEVVDTQKGKKIGCQEFPQQTLDVVASAIEHEGLTLKLHGTDITQQVKKLGNYEQLPF